MDNAYIHIHKWIENRSETLLDICRVLVFSARKNICRVTEVDDEMPNTVNLKQVKLSFYFRGYRTFSNH